MVIVHILIHEDLNITNTFAKFVYGGLSDEQKETRVGDSRVIDG